MKESKSLTTTVLEATACEVVSLMLMLPWDLSEIMECVKREGEDRTADVEESVELAIDYLKKVLDERF